MLRIGQYQTLRVSRVTPRGYVLGRGEAQVLLPRSRELAEQPAVGESLRVFVYMDSEDRPVATLRTPYATVGEIACLQVVDVTPYGAFLDWGLDKDLFVPRSEQHVPMRVGRRYVVAVTLDERTQRVMAATRLGKHFDYDLSDVQVGDRVDLLVYGFNELGARVVVDGRYAGLVYEAEAHKGLAVGDELTGYVRTIRDDNKLDIRLQREGRAGVQDAREEILDHLRRAGGFLPLHDGSSPEAIVAALDMSKKAFKRAVGGLFKDGHIELLDDGIRLRAPESRRPGRPAPR